ncbi:MAG: hypothetical protein SH809_17440 [Rhodothermales bacterium]|nr:hypothetical protein [Rhodothermales bacterium]
MLATLVPMLLFAACTETPRESEMPQDDAMTEVPGAYAGAMDDYRTRVERDLDNLDMEIDAFRMHMESDTETLSDSFRVRVAGLQYRRDALETELRALPDATEDQQESRRQAIDTQWRRIVEDLESLRLSAIDDRGAFEQAIDARLTELEMELSDFQRYAAADKPANTERHAETMQTLQEDLNELSTTLSTFQSASDTAFEAQRTELADAVADLGARIREATQEVRQNDDSATVVRSSLP